MPNHDLETRHWKPATRPLIPGTCLHRLARARRLFVPLAVGALIAACTPPADDAPGNAAAGGSDPSATQPIEADHFVPSTPENVAWGWFPIDKEPVLRMRSGETVSREHADLRRCGSG